MKNLLKLLMFVSLAAGFNAQAADDSISGTITINGALSPKVFSIDIALLACDAGKTLATCTTELDTDSFSGHTDDATLALGNLVDGSEEGDNFRYVKFEIKSKTVINAEDYLVISKALTSTTNDIEVALRQLNFVSGGNSSFGQTTLGDAAAAGTSLDANEAMLDGVDLALTSTLTEVYNQSTDNPATVNAKVFQAVGAPKNMVLRGILEIAYGDTATSENYEAVIQVQLKAKDGNP